jgi:hypothetical protein
VEDHGCRERLARFCRRRSRQRQASGSHDVRSRQGSCFLRRRNGKADIDAGVYANMVRVGKLSDKDPTATIIAGGTATDNSSAIVTALAADGTKKWSVQLPTSGGRPSIQSAFLAPGRPWFALGISTGVIHVIDAERGVVIATVDGQGQFPQVAWMRGKDSADPLLVVAGRTGLTAFRVTR